MGPTPVFNQAMEALAPFEAQPVLAVAVSGGSDSMALCLLADEWARARGGRVVALTVDHGLRAESAEEAETVRRWLAARGIGHHILRWEGDKPRSGVQEEARRARYRLLEDWCREHRVLHLLLGHHADDQAETILMRRARGSGAVGLAGMSAVRELTHARLLRPLLAAPKSALRAYLQAQGQAWVEDSGNASPAYARTRLRAQKVTVTPQEAEAAGRTRAALEARVAEALAGLVRMTPEGTTVAPGWEELEPDIGFRLWLAVLMAVSGKEDEPRHADVRRLSAAMGEPEWRGATLHGCLLKPVRDGVAVRLEKGGAAPHIERKRGFGLTAAPFVPAKALP